MIIHMARGATTPQEKAVLDRITAAGFKYEIIHGSTGIDVIGILGDLSGLEESYFSEIDGVDRVMRISKPYKLVSRQYSPSDKNQVGDYDIGGGDLALMAGPCSLETEEQVMTIAAYVSALGIRIMRGGAYKPRTSPYSFQGMGSMG